MFLYFILSAMRKFQLYFFDCSRWQFNLSSCLTTFDESHTLKQTSRIFKNP